jgi:ABC-type antimicrobial peptide transport system permease subunit
MSFIVRTSLDAAATTNILRAAVRELDKDLPVDPVQPLAAMVSGTADEPRFRATLVAVFAGAALILAAIGLYGVISQTVAQRTREMGIRIALGGTPGHVLEIVLRDGLVLTAIGLAAGLVLASVLTSAIRTLLFEVTPSDPSTFAGVAILLLAIAAAACYLPARRAMRVDPMTALRVE